MANAFRIEYNTRISSAMQNDVNVAAGRKAAFIATVAMVSARALLFVMGMLSGFINGLPFFVFDAVMLLVSAGFGIMIYKGVRGLAILALIGGFVSLWSEWQNGALTGIFRLGNLFMTLHGAAFIIAIMMTIVPMTYLLISANYRKYAEAVSKINKDLMEEQKARKKG